jgi:hypothetical protein
MDLFSECQRHPSRVALGFSGRWFFERGAKDMLGAMDHMACAADNHRVRLVHDMRVFSGVVDGVQEMEHAINTCALLVV